VLIKKKNSIFFLVYCMFRYSYKQRQFSTVVDNRDITLKYSVGHEFFVKMIRNTSGGWQLKTILMGKELNTHILVKVKNVTSVSSSVRAGCSFLGNMHTCSQEAVFPSLTFQAVFLTSCVVCCSSSTNIFLSHGNDLISSHRFSFINEAFQ